MQAEPDHIAAIRAFNRFYTRVIGLLDEGIMRSPYSLAEARVIHELGKLDRATSGALARLLGMDAGQLSRLVWKLSDKQVLSVVPNPDDARANDLVLTSAGELACAELNALSDAAASALLSPLSTAQRAQLVDCMQTISGLLANPDEEPSTVLRPPRIGEIGWLIHRQGLLYHQEQGWNQEFEVLIARIYAEYGECADMHRKSLWVADRGGQIAGSVFVLPHADHPDEARLRMLYVEPSARGLGLGHQLVGAAVDFARSAGYQTLTLWTQDCLSAARKVYQTAGFVLVAEERHHSFGADLNGQYWSLDLR